MSFTIGPPQAQPTTGGMSSPNLLIPDADAVGVEDAIAIDAVGTLAAINLRVEIFHTWIGDLDVTLVAPNGSQVSVHSREGGNTRDLIATIKSADHIGLAGLVGAPIQGTWKLRVVDDVQRDVGRLAHWSIDIAFDRTQVASGYAEPDTAIPDSSSAGIESLIGLEYDGTVSDITVSVDIEHTFIGDLQVDLVAPSGASARLHDNDGGSQDDIVRSYDLTSTPALTPLIGQPIKGDWRLRVRDIAAVDVGRLKAWSLNIGP
jgi:subtilisin-like proprotein convertase family protein